jgi:cytochrome c oxidase assembly factor CtaG
MWVALLSPIGVFSELLFFMHMIQHLILILITAPLILLGAPLLPTLWALPRDLRVKVGLLFASRNSLGRPVGVLTHPLTTVSIYVVVMAVWHVPPLYDAAQGRTLIHDLEHFFFIASATLFWWPVIHPAGGRRRLSFAAGIPYFLPPMMEGNLIGALLVFADRPLYSAYHELPSIWGISAMQDQQLAGLIMWVPGGLFFIIPIFTLLTLMFQEEGRQADRAVQRGYKDRK